MQNIILFSYWMEKNKLIKMNLPDNCYILNDITLEEYNKIDFNLNYPKIYISVEPELILSNESFLLNKYKDFHTIFTYNQHILDSCNNSKIFIPSSCWIDKLKYQNIDLSKKKFQISNLSGSKEMCMAHTFRKHIHNNQNLLIEFPIIFFISSFQKPVLEKKINNRFLNEDKFDLFECFQFAIIIENTNQDNCLSEKIIDCLITKTIPIYYGAKNINKIFNTDGWIILNNLDINELIEKLKNLNNEYYLKYINIIEYNYEEAKKYTDVYNNLISASNN